jgi:6-pyruvoyl-tetrahydropterin synthase
MIFVARRYRFHAYHSVPSLPPPWCDTHSHNYTVEVVAADESDTEVVVDTDQLDACWAKIGPGYPNRTRDLNDTHDSTTVEALARAWLDGFASTIPQVVEVTVWEDDDRWGRAR